MGEIHHVPVGITALVFHPAQCEDDVRVPFAGKVLGGIERLVQRDAEPTLEEHGMPLLPAHMFEQLEVLRIPGAYLEHHTGGVACFFEGFVNLVNVPLMGHFHRDDADIVLAGKLKNPGQAGRAVSLERVGTRARFVGTHARALLTMFLERLHHDFHMFGRVNSAQAGEYMQVILAEAHPIVIESLLPIFFAVASEDAVALLYAHCTLHAGKRCHGFLGQTRSITEQVYLRQDLALAVYIMERERDVIERLQMVGQLGKTVRRAVCVGLENEYHGKGGYVAVDGFRAEDSIRARQER